jgi:hypothetical protein
MAAVLVFVIGFSHAMFTATTSGPENLLSTGELRLSVSPTGPVVSDTGALKPGDTRTGTVTVKNVSSKAKVRLSVIDLTEGAAPKLSGVIVLTVRETAPATAQRYRGSIGGLSGLALGTWASAEQRTYEIEIAWPSTETDSGLRGKQAAFKFEWYGESVCSGC